MMAGHGWQHMMRMIDGNDMVGGYAGDDMMVERDGYAIMERDMTVGHGGYDMMGKRWWNDLMERHDG